MWLAATNQPNAFLRERNDVRYYANKPKTVLPEAKTLSFYFIAIVTTAKIKQLWKFFILVLLQL